MASTLIQLSALLALIVCCQAVHQAQHSEKHHVEYHHHPIYKFDYGVHDSKTHDIKTHREHRDGDKTEGEYTLHEPDGTIRTVKYHVHGKSGFVATVHRSGHAYHPHTKTHKSHGF